MKWIPTHLQLLLRAVGGLVAAACVHGAEISRLDAFETDVAKPDAPHEQSSTDDDGSLVGHLFADLVAVSLGYGGEASLARINPDLTDLDFDDTFVRETGEPLIPFLRLDADRQRISPDLDAWNYSVEAGFGPAALRFRQQRFNETNPEDRLDLYEGEFLYRMSFGVHVELDLGAGMIALDGNDYERRGVVTMPLLIHASEAVGLEFRPVLGEDLKVYDVAVLFGFRYVEWKAGWRWTRSPLESLDGPYFGIALFY